MVLLWGKVCPLHGIRFQTINRLVETNTDQQNDPLPFDHSVWIAQESKKEITGSYAICPAPQICKFLIVSAFYGNSQHQKAVCVKLHMGILALRNSVLEIFSSSRLTLRKGRSVPGVDTVN